MLITTLKAASAALLVMALAAGAKALPLIQASDGSTAAKDEAKIARLIERLGSDVFAEREKASKELRELGSAALGALRRAAKGGDSERRRRAADLIRKIEGNPVAAAVSRPKQVRLVYRATPLAEAVADFNTRSGGYVALADPEGKLVGRTVTLDTGEVTFWRALARFCEAAGVDEAPNRPGVLPRADRDKAAGSSAGNPRQVTLVDGKPKVLPTDDATAVRFRALGRAEAVGVPAAKEHLLRLEVALEPRLRWERLVEVTVDKARDDRGQELVPAPAEVDSGTDPRVRLAVVRLKRGTRGSMALKELSGSVTARVIGPTTPLVTVTDVLNAAGKTVTGMEGGSVHVVAATSEGAGYLLSLQVWLPTGRAASAASRGDRVFLASHGTDGFGRYELTVTERSGGLVPLSGFGMTKSRGRVQFHIRYRPRPGQGPPARLVLGESRGVSVSLPFTLENVPLP